MTVGACPPNSMVIRLTCFAASSARPEPTFVEPVKETFRISGELISWVEIIEGSPNTTDSAPGGIPASRKHCAVRSADRGVSSAGLMMQEQPAARAVEIFRAD